jgi:hypothetical protein
MPIKRRLSKGKPHRITEDAVAAWLAGDSVLLHRALDLRPWDTSPFDVSDDGEVVVAHLIAIPDDDYECDRRGVGTALRLRRELLAYGQPGRVGRHGRPWQPGDDDEDWGDDDEG